MAGDSSFASVVALLRGDGPDASTTLRNIAPDPPVVIAASGDISIRTAQGKFPGGAIAFGTTNAAYFSLGASAAWRAAANMTVEFWVYLSARPASGSGVLATASSGAGFHDFSSVDGVSWQVWATATGISFQMMADWQGSGIVGVAVPLNSWVHVAFTLAAGSMRGFVDGALSGSAGNGVGGIYQPGTDPTLMIGSITGAGTGTDLVAQGFMQEFRFTSGVARYTSAFTAPTSRFVAGAYAVGGATKMLSGIPVSRVVRAYRRDTGALVGETVSDAATGQYALGFRSAAEVSVVALDDAEGTVENDLILRAIPA